MEKAKKIKLFFSLLYFFIIISFLLLIFSNFSISEISNYEFIKNNTDRLYFFKNSNLILLSIFFILFTIIWIVLLGFGSPIFLVGGFLFGKWLGTIIVIFSLTLTTAYRKGPGSGHVNIHTHLLKTQISQFGHVQQIWGRPFCQKTKRMRHAPMCAQMINHTSKTHKLY